MATVSTTLKQVFKDKKLTNSAKLISKSKIETFSLSKLIDEFNLGLLDGGHSKDEEAEVPEDAIATFEDSYFKPIDNRVKLLVDGSKQDFSYTHLVHNFQNFVLSIEGMLTATPALKDSINVDSYISNMLEKDTLGIIAVKLTDKTYFYFFKQVPPMIKNEAIKFIQQTLENNTEQENKDKFEKYGKWATNTRKENRRYLSIVDDIDTPRALFDKEARKRVVWLNTLNTLFS